MGALPKTYRFFGETSRSIGRILVPLTKAGEVAVDDGPFGVIGSTQAIGKRRMIMNAALKSVLCVVAIGYASIVNGQVIFNPPRGTVEGDVR